MNIYRICKKRNTVRKYKPGTKTDYNIDLQIP